MVKVIIVFPSQKKCVGKYRDCEPDLLSVSLLFLFFLPQSLIEAHDKVAAKCYEMSHAAVNSDFSMTSSLMPADAVRMIGIQKKAGEPLVSLSGIYINHSCAEQTCDAPVRLLSVILFY